MTIEIVAGIVVALVSLALVAIPLFAKKPAATHFHSDGEIQQEVERYRASIKAKTLCDRCLSPNPARSNYCMECGTAL